MRIRVAAVALGLMIAIVWPTAGWAQGDPAQSTQPAPPWGPFPWVGANPLGMTPDQVTRIQQIVTKWQAELAPMLERRNALRSALTDEQKAVFDRQGLGYGQGRGPCGMGLGRGRGLWMGRSSQ